MSIPDPTTDPRWKRLGSPPDPDDARPPRHRGRLLEFNLPGHVIHYIHTPEPGSSLNYSRCTLSGYERPDTFNVTGESRSDDINLEGAFVLDKRAVLEDRPGLAVSMPMVDSELKPEAVDRCPQPSGAMLAGLQGSFKQLATIKAADPKFSGLDTVSVETFVDLWRKVGARVGRIIDGQIEWEA